MKHGGLVIYLQQEGRGIGLANKIAAYALQERGMDTVDANRALGFEDDTRTYEPVRDILRHLGISSVQVRFRPVVMYSVLIRSLVAPVDDEQSSQG